MPDTPSSSNSARAKSQSLFIKLLSLLGAILCVAYLMNPSAGFLEWLPDNIPLIGNLDEATATILLLICLSNLGIQLLPATRRLFRKDLPRD